MFLLDDYFTKRYLRFKISVELLSSGISSISLSKSNRGPRRKEESS